MKNPSELLFNTVHGKKKVALFSRPSVLARELNQLEDGGFENQKLGSVSALVTLVLKPGHDKNSRPLTDSFREGLTKLIRKKGEEDLSIDVNSILDELWRAFEHWKKPRPSDVGGDLAQFISDVRDSGDAFFINFSPSKCEDIEHASILKSMLVEKLALDYGTNRSNPSPGTCWFFFSSVREAQAFWLGLHQHLIRDGLENNHLRVELKNANRGENKRIRVLSLETNLMLFTYAVLDPFDDNRSGYFLSDHGKLRAARFHNDDIEAWIESFFLPLQEGSETFKKNEVTWEEVESLLPSDAASVFNVG